MKVVTRRILETASLILGIGIEMYWRKEYQNEKETILITSMSHLKSKDLGIELLNRMHLKMRKHNIAQVDDEPEDATASSFRKETTSSDD